jgi:transposase
MDREIEVDETDKREGPWVTSTFECPNCHHKWVEVAHFSTRGIFCPLCKHENPEFSWLERAMGSD